MNSPFDEALTEDVKEAIREALRSIKRNTPGFRNRPAQNKLVAEVSRTLAGVNGDRKILVAEAPTGTGKSIGYMLGAIPVAKSRDHRLIISTGTVALQEQLVNRDLPSLQEKSGMDFTFILAKGRGRYACNRNIADLTNSDASQTSLLSEAESVVGSGTWAFQPSQEQVRLVMKMENALIDQSWSGDLDDWKGDAIDDQMRQSIVTDHGGCLGRNCAFFYQCGFHKARTAMKSADVIVANHDLVMSDIGLGGGAILPPPEETIYIFDEAHHLPDVALAHGAAETSLGKSLETIQKTPKLLSETFSALRKEPQASRERVASAQDSCNDLVNYIGEAKTFIEANFPAVKKGKFHRKGEPEVWRFPHGQQPEDILFYADKISGSAKKVSDKVKAALTELREAFKTKQIDQNVATKVGKNLSFQQKRLENLYAAWDMMANRDVTGKPPVARWITKTTHTRGARKNETDIMVSCSPTSAADILRGGLWDKCAGAIMTSATVSALGRFDRFSEKAGLGMRDGTQYLLLQSPFNYPENGLLVIPAMYSDPAKPDQHTDEVVRLINEEVDLNLGTLVLFSARKQMQEVAEKVNQPIREQLLIQGEMSKGDILQSHQKRIEEGKGSTIFGLASFSEGVDLPGKLCEHVLIAKLPFAVPDSPVDATYSEWLESVGRNPFMEISVPDACTKLVQACGRLIRTETDTGRITLLDRRIVTKRYGSQILNSLPPFSRRVDAVQQRAS